MPAAWRRSATQWTPSGSAMWSAQPSSRGSTSALGGDGPEHGHDQDVSTLASSTSMSPNGVHVSASGVSSSMA